MTIQNKLSALLLAAAFCVAPLANAQFYAGAQFGYGFSATNDVFSSTDETIDAQGRMVSRKNIYGTVGSGLTAQINLGYFINPHLRFDLGAYYLHGAERLSRRSVRPTETFESHVYTRQMRLTPSIVVQTGHGMVQPFARFGIVMPLGGKTVSTETYSNDAGLSSEKITEINGAFSLGFESGAGVVYQATEKLGISVECVYTGLRIKSAKATVVKNERTANGVTTDDLAITPTYGIETIFVDEVTNSSNNPFYNTQGTLNIDEPAEELARRVNFSVVSIRIGAFYKF
jgi:opacity protein-like surface antigen